MLASASPQDYRLSSDITVHQTEVHCECDDCGTSGCNGVHNEGGSAYTSTGTLRTRTMHITECNSACSCGIECPNRVTQRGRQVPVTIFKTANGRGWGLRTDKWISSGTFLVEYVGELLTQEEVAKRSGNYIFDLDYNGGGDPGYAVDAEFYGNVSHFINHSVSAGRRGKPDEWPALCV